MSAEVTAKSKASRRKGAATVARAYFEALARQDLDEALACWKPGSTDTMVGMEELSVPAGVRRFFGELFAAVPEFRFEVISVVAQKEKVAVRWRAGGTFDGTGTFQGLRPNGARLDLEGLDLLTVEDELIVSNFAYFNGMELARQLGALPPAGSAAERAMTVALNAKVAAAKQLEKLRNR